MTWPHVTVKQSPAEPTPPDKTQRPHKQATTPPSHQPPLRDLSSSSPSHAATPPRPNSKAPARPRAAPARQPASHRRLLSPHLTQMPPPPPSLSARAPERRLAVLLSHFRPCRDAPRATTTRLASAERHGTEAEAEVSASPCAAAGSGEDQPSSRGCCVFCSIVAGAAPAFKVWLFSQTCSAALCHVIAPLREAFSACPGLLSVCAQTVGVSILLSGDGRPRASGADELEPVACLLTDSVCCVLHFAAVRG